MKEKRFDDERDCCEIEGEFRFLTSAVKTPCLVVNLSERGAGLEVPDDVSLPSQFYLSLPLFEQLSDERLVDLRWQKGRSAGVMFINASPHAAAAPSKQG